MSASFEINKAAHQAASRTAHEFPEAGAQLFRWDKCPHCHLPLPTEKPAKKVVYCRGIAYPIEKAPRHYTDKNGVSYALRMSTGTYVCIG